ncbi:MAG: dihydroorotase family protein [Patescibacteria group bacterium]|nr:dihydroorotase family protein [Patescibacteria group bacterium]
MRDIIIKNTRLFTGGKVSQPQDLFISRGLISNIRPGTGAKIINGSGKIVLPGLVDPHVHIRDFKLSPKEDFKTGSLAAARGGFTYFIDMPNTLPPVASLKTLALRKKAAKKSLIPCGFHFGALARDNTPDISKALTCPEVHSVKVYLNSTTGDLFIQDQKLLDKIFAVAGLISVHAEGEDKIELALKLAKKHHTRLYLCHISRKAELELIKKYKTQNPNQFFIEVSPHHLFLTKKDLLSAWSQKSRRKNHAPKLYPGFFMMRPPLASKKDQQALWQAIDQGIVDTIGTDHAPHTLEEKKAPNPPYGVPGLETALPLMLNANHNKIVKISKIVALMSENPARIFNLKNQARIIAGQPANLVLIDPALRKTVTSKELKTKCGWSPFLGFNLTGWPIMTITNGKIVYKKPVKS